MRPDVLSTLVLAVVAVVLGVTAFVRNPGWLVTIFYQD